MLHYFLMVFMKKLQVMSNTYIKKGTYTKETVKESSQSNKKELLKVVDFLNYLNWPNNTLVSYNNTYNPDTIYKTGDIVMIDDSWRGVTGYKIEESNIQPEEYLFLPDLNNDGVSDQNDVQELLASFTNGTYSTQKLKFNYWYKVGDNYVKVVNDIISIGSEELKTIGGQTLKGDGNIDALVLSDVNGVNTYKGESPISYVSDNGIVALGMCENTLLPFDENSMAILISNNLPSVTKVKQDSKLGEILSKVGIELPSNKTRTTDNTLRSVQLGISSINNTSILGFVGISSNEDEMESSVVGLSDSFTANIVATSTSVKGWCWNGSAGLFGIYEPTIQLSSPTNLVTVNASDQSLVINASSISLRSTSIDEAYEEGVEPQQFAYTADGELTMIPLYNQESSTIQLPFTGILGDSVSGDVESDTYFNLIDMQGRSILTFEDGEISSDYGTFGSLPKNGNSFDVLMLDSSKNAVWSNFYKATDLSYRDIYGNISLTQNTANCYVVKKTGWYKFPLVYGNAIKDGKDNTAAYTNLALNEHMLDFVNARGNQITSPYIEVDLGETLTTGLFTIGDAPCFKNVFVCDGYLYFQISYIPTGGANGILSVKDSENNIIWNWHIWVFPYDLTSVTIINNTGIEYNIMPVYLATTYDSGDSTKRKNWYYQWGRSVPMVGPRSYTAYGRATCYGSFSFNTKSNSSGAYQQGILNPTTFWVYGDNTKRNWFGTSSYYNLWDANCSSTGYSDNITVKTVYDPSPVGFKVPNGNTFTFFYRQLKKSSYGYYFKKNTSDTTGIYFPMTGFLDTKGYISMIGSSGVGQLWTTGVFETSVHAPAFGDMVIVNSGSPYMEGSSICCVAE